jgi:hypothetical protein
MSTFIDDSALLDHRSEYDPVKAREYYLRTRQLKGRVKGRQDQPSGRQPAARQTTISRSRPASAPKAAPKGKAGGGDLASQKKALEARLERLRDVLAELVEASKKRSGVETKAEKKADKKSKSEPDKPEKKMTAKQKKAQAERAEKARKEEARKNPKPDKVTGGDLEELREKIADIKAQIKKALEDARKSHSKTAPKGR